MQSSRIASRLAIQLSSCKVCLRQWPRQTSLGRPTRVWTRHASTQQPGRIPKHVEKPIAKVEYAYPKSLLIYHAGTIQTATVGMIRVSTIMVFAAGCLVAAPAAYFDSTTSNWLVPITVALAAVPMAVTYGLTAPFVASIQLAVPNAARRSKSDLLRFARNTPADTIVEFTTMRFMPFPKRAAVRFKDLKPVQTTFKLANLEAAPKSTIETSSPLRELQKTQKQFFVRHGGQYTKSTRAPGVWLLLWEQIQGRLAR